jgi:hypothetical protein
MSLVTILLIILIVLAFGGGGFGLYSGAAYGWPVGGLGGLLLLILIICLLTGRL